MIGMYMSRDGLVGSLGKKIRAIQSPHENPVSAYFGKSAWVTSPYNTWKAIATLDPAGIILGVQDEARQWLARSEGLQEVQKTEAEEYVAKCVDQWQGYVAAGQWNRETVINEFEYQIQAYDRRHPEYAAAFRAALEDF